MKIFTVHEPPDPSGNSIDRATSLIFLKYGFSWGAFFLAPLYYILKNQWFVFCVYMLALLAIGVLTALLEQDPQLMTFYMGLMQIFFGFETSTLHRFWLHFRGWKEVGSITGRSQDECERLYFSEIFRNTPTYSSFQTEAKA